MNNTFIENNIFFVLDVEKSVSDEKYDENVKELYMNELKSNSNPLSCNIKYNIKISIYHITITYYYHCSYLDSILFYCYFI